MADCARHRVATEIARAADNCLLCFAEHEHARRQEAEDNAKGAEYDAGLLRAELEEVRREKQEAEARSAELKAIGDEYVTETDAWATALLARIEEAEAQRDEAIAQAEKAIHDRTQDRFEMDALRERLAVVERERDEAYVTIRALVDKRGHTPNRGTCVVCHPDGGGSCNFARSAS